MAEEQSKGQKLAEELLRKPKNLGEFDPELLGKASEFCEGYKTFLNKGKTEREAAAYSEELLLAAGAPGRRVVAAVAREAAAAAARFAGRSVRVHIFADDGSELASA